MFTRYIALVGLAIVYGSAFLLMKVAVETASPVQIVAGRVVFGALVVLAIVCARRRPLRLNRRVLGATTVLAVAGALVPFALIAWAETRIESGSASVLVSTMPLFTALFAAFVLADERLTTAAAGGLFVGIAGVAVLTGGVSASVEPSALIAQGAVIAAAAGYATAAVVARRFLGGEDAFNIAGLELTIGTVLILPVLAVSGEAHATGLSFGVVAAIVALGIFHTGLATVGYLAVIERVGSVRASLITYLIPVVGLVLGWVFLDEAIPLRTVGGAALIIAGTAIVLTRGERPSQPEPEPQALAAVPVETADAC